MRKLNEKGICYETGGWAMGWVPIRNGDWVYSLVYKEDDIPYGI
jgi:hypothetical protein